MGDESTAPFPQWVWAVMILGGGAAAGAAGGGVGASQTETVSEADLARVEAKIDKLAADVNALAVEIARQHGGGG